MIKKAKYFRWILMAVLLVLVWQHSHWAVALALTVLFVWHEASIYLDELAFSDLFLYSSEYWRARMCPDEATTRLALAKHIYDTASKERFKAVQEYNSVFDLYAASRKRQPDLPISAVDKAQELVEIAYAKADRAYENLKAAGGE
jgi:hypothetical protein